MEVCFPNQKRRHEAQWVGAGGSWPSAHLEEGIGRTEFLRCSVSSSLTMTPALGSNGEGDCADRRERGQNQVPALPHLGYLSLISLNAHQVQGKEDMESTLHTSMCMALLPVPFASFFPYFWCLMILLKCIQTLMKESNIMLWINSIPLPNVFLI